MTSVDKTQAMVEHLTRLNPFSGAENLPDPPRPEEKSIPSHLSSCEKIPYIQKLLDTLSYNHLPHTFFSLEKHRPLQSILITAKEVLTEALPIRCLEATFVGLLLTQDLKDVDRIPLSFKSEVNGSFYRHIVLVLHVRSPAPLFGALGLSRKRTLMYKPLTYPSLYAVVMDYKKEYEALGHALIDIKLGLPVSHEHRSRFNPCWRFVALKLEAYLRRTTPPKVAAPKAAPEKEAGDGQGGSAATSSNPLVPLADAGEATDRSSHEPFSEEATAGVGADGTPSGGGIATGVGGATAPSASPLVGPAPRIPEPADMDGDDNALSRFLAKFTRLLPTIAEQYYKGIPAIDSLGRASRLCFLDLDEAERDAGAENQRRVRLINGLQSPLSSEARKAASTRALKAPRDKDKDKDKGRASHGKLRKRSRSKKRSRTATRPSPPLSLSQGAAGPAQGTGASPSEGHSASARGGGGGAGPLSAGPLSARSARGATSASVHSATSRSLVARGSATPPGSRVHSARNASSSSQAASPVDSDLFNCSNNAEG